MKILDFGLARVTDDDAQLTQSGMLLGTPKYMAPEQTTGEEIDARADLFSLGSVIYHMAAGKAPFAGKNVTATLMAVAHHEATPVQDVNPMTHPLVALLVKKLLEKDPEARPQSAKAVVNGIRKIEKRIASGKDSDPTVPIPQLDTATAHERRDMHRRPRHNTRRRPGCTAADNQSLGKRPTGLWITASTLLLFLAFGGYLLYGILFKVKTSDGTLVIEVDDPKNVVVEIDGREAKVKRADGKFITLSLEAGTKKLVVKTTDGTVLKTSVGEKVEIAAGEKTSVRAWVEDVPSSFALSFDGKDDYVLLPRRTVDPAKPFTVEATVQLAKGASGFSVILGAGSPYSRTETGFFLGRREKEGKGSWTCELWPTNIGLHYSHLNPYRLNNTQRTHVAAVWDGKQMKTYIDGKYVGYSNVTKEVISRKLTPVWWTLGMAPGSKNPFHGAIDEVRVSSSVRYVGDFRPASRFQPDKETIALYHCDRGTGNILADSSGNQNHGRIHGARWVAAASSRSNDRETALWLHKLGAGIKVRMGEELKSIGAGDDVPEGEMTLEFIDLSHKQNFVSNDLAKLRNCKGVRRLYLSNTLVDDKGLQNFKEWTQLEFLDLSNTKVAGPGLESLRSCKKLKQLRLAGTNFTDANVSSILPFKKLTHVDLKGTQVTDDAIAKLTAALPNCNVDSACGGG